MDGSYIVRHRSGGENRTLEESTSAICAYRGVFGGYIDPRERRHRPQQNDALLRARRFLSLVLRHKPEAAGITLDSHGWAEVDALLAGMAPRHTLTMAQLEEIVRTDDKQRYAFNDSKTKIRANQGDSVPVDVELTECEPPELLYHGTGEKYVDSILEHGLIPKSRLYVHLSKDLETAKLVGLRHGTPVVFAVQSGEMYRHGAHFYRSGNGVWLTERVPSQFLSR